MNFPVICGIKPSVPPAHKDNQGHQQGGYRQGGGEGYDKGKRTHSFNSTTFFSDIL
jgi:hypothetical protein